MSIHFLSLVSFQNGSLPYRVGDVLYYPYPNPAIIHCSFPCSFWKGVVEPGVAINTRLFVKTGEFVPGLGLYRESDLKSIVEDDSEVV